MGGRLSHLLRQAWLVATTRLQTRHCTSVGRRVRAEGRLVIHNGGQIHLGDYVRIRASHVPVELGAFPGGILRIGENVFINSGTSICAQQSVTIGKNCAIGNYTLIMDTDFHAVEDHTQPPRCAPVTIEEDVWLGARVTVLKGVTIGRGAVVAAGAVVTRDVPPNTLVAGVPARVIRNIQ